MIVADAGGSNGYRVRAWKVELAKLAKETGLRIAVPLPARNVEVEPHRAPHVQLHHRELVERHLTRLPTIIELISATTTPTCIRPASKITNKQLAAVRLEPHDFHGEWNYTIA